MANEKANVAKALQVVVDMIVDCGPDDRMSARVAMLLHMVETRVEPDTYCAMLKELAQYIDFQLKESRSAQATRRFRVCLESLADALLGQDS